MNFDLDDDQRDLPPPAPATSSPAAASPADARAALDGRRRRRARPQGAGRHRLRSASPCPRPPAVAAARVLDLAVVAEQAGRGARRAVAGRPPPGPPSCWPATRPARRAGRRLDLRVSRSSTARPGRSTPSAPTPSSRCEDGALVVRAGRGHARRADRRHPRARPTSAHGDAAVLGPDADARWARAPSTSRRSVLAAEGLGAAGRARASSASSTRRSGTRSAGAIGSYQAVKHALVDAWVGVEQLRSLVWWAAWAADHAPDELPLAAAAAKASAAETLERAAETLIQVHGGIGFTWEHDAHLYWRRAKVDRFLLGDEAARLDAVARLALAGAAHDRPGGAQPRRARRAVPRAARRLRVAVLRGAAGTARARSTTGRPRVAGGLRAHRRRAGRPGGRADDEHPRGVRHLPGGLAGRRRGDAGDLPAEPRRSCGTSSTDSGATAAVISPELLPLLARRRGGLDSPGVVVGDDRADAGHHPVRRAGEPPSRPTIEPRADDDLAALLYTGGTTGRAKGVMLSHRGLWESGRGIDAVASDARARPGRCCRCRSRTPTG